MTDRDPHDSDLEALLGRALRTETAGIVPAGDGLARIRDRVDGRGRTAWWKPALALVAAAAGGLLVGGLVLPGVGGADGTASTVNELTPAESTPSATPTPEAGSDGIDGIDGPAASPSATTTAPSTSRSPGASAALPVYYLHDDGSGPRLYREFHLAADGGTGGAAAVREMLRGEPVDPDYTSLWAAGTELLGYAVEDGVVTVDLSAEALDGSSAGSAGAATSLQQLVYTVTAVEGDGSLRVRLTVEGEPVPELWGALDTREPVARAPMLDVQGQVWILGPTQGERSASPVEVTVYGTAFEGTVVLQVTATGRDEVLAEQVVTTAMGEFVDAATSFELPPGDYTVRALSEYGEAMELLERDSKEFRVG